MHAIRLLAAVLVAKVDITLRAIPGLTGALIDHERDITKRSKFFEVKSHRFLCCLPRQPPNEDFSLNVINRLSQMLLTCHLQLWFRELSLGTDFSHIVAYALVRSALQSCKVHWRNWTIASLISSLFPHITHHTRPLFSWLLKIENWKLKIIWKIPPGAVHITRSRFVAILGVTKPKCVEYLVAVVCEGLGHPAVRITQLEEKL